MNKAIKKLLVVGLMTMTHLGITAQNLQQTNDATRYQMNIWPMQSIWKK